MRASKNAWMSASVTSRPSCANGRKWLISSSLSEERVSTHARVRPRKNVPHLVERADAVQRAVPGKRLQRTQAELFEREARVWILGRLVRVLFLEKKWVCLQRGQTLPCVSTCEMQTSPRKRD